MVIDERLREGIRRGIAALCLLSGDSVYFGIGRAADIATWIADQGMVILGMEGFRCDGKSVIQLSAFVADFGSLTGPRAERVVAARKACLEVLSRWSDEVQFVEFTLDD
jgi:hypothetical protein